MKAGLCLLVHVGNLVRASLEDPEGLWVLASDFPAFSHGLYLIVELLLRPALCPCFFLVLFGQALCTYGSCCICLLQSFSSCPPLGLVFSLAQRSSYSLFTFAMCAISVAYCDISCLMSFLAGWRLQGIKRPRVSHVWFVPGIWQLRYLIMGGQCSVGLGIRAGWGHTSRPLPLCCLLVFWNCLCVLCPPLHPQASGNFLLLILEITRC